MSGAVQQAVKVAIVGMDARSSNALALAFKHRARGFCLIVDSVAQADGVLFDMDAAGAAAAWESIQEKHPAIPKIVISREAVEMPGASYLSKPLSVNSLVDTIAKVTGREFDPNANFAQPVASSGVASTLNKRIDENAPSNQNTRAKQRFVTDMQALYYNREAFMEGLLIRAVSDARKKQQAVRIQCFGDTTLLLSPAEGRIYTNISDGTLRNLSIIPLKEQNISESDLVWLDAGKAAMLAKSEALKSADLDCFLWDLSVMTSRGRIPHGESIDQPVYLKHWPNLTRYRPVPEAMRIAGLWVKQPTTLLKLFDLLEIPFEHVLTFYSAASAVGLAGAGNRRADSLVDSEGPSHSENRGLFGSILKRLSGKMGKVA